MIVSLQNSEFSGIILANSASHESVRVVKEGIRVIGGNCLRFNVADLLVEKGVDEVGRHCPYDCSLKIKTGLIRNQEFFSPCPLKVAIEGLRNESPVLYAGNLGEDRVIEGAIAPVNDNIAALGFEHLDVDGLKLNLETDRNEYDERNRKSIQQRGPAVAESVGTEVLEGQQEVSGVGPEQE